MAKPKGPKKTLRLEHVRAPDYREIFADGAMSRVEGDIVRITFYINDQMTTHENMELQSSDEIGATYRATGLEEKNQRMDLGAVRMPLTDFLSLYENIAKRMPSQADKESSGSE